jgi:DNA repair exonuclease SbcCD ATPase subunit
VFALYGKPLRKITKPQLVNTINNKELVVELAFDIGVDKYFVRRGMKPTIFEIFKNDILINQDAASRDYQEFLETDILKMSYKAITQIVILGSATYVPFMELTTGNRREIIEDLLDIQVFTTMNTLLKEKISQSKLSLEENKNKIELVKSKLELAKENSESIRKLRDDEIEKIHRRIKTQLDIIEENNSTIKYLNIELLELREKNKSKHDTEQRHSKFKDLKMELDFRLKGLNVDIGFYRDNDTCPTCKQGIDHGFKAETLSQKNNQKEEIGGAIEKISEKMSTLASILHEISNIEREINSTELKMNECRSQIRIAKSALQGCKKEVEETEQEVKIVDNSKIVEYNKQLKDIEKHQEELFLERETLGIAATMLKDGGIKTRIIRQYVPVMNKLINKYLAAFDLFVDFHLDDSFNEVIKSRYRDTFSYNSFSEGEKMRINISILLCWREIAKLRNSVSTNLLILDETLDGSMDTDGVGDLIDTLHQLNKNDNVFVISHRGEVFGEKFEHNIKFEKIKNFSQMIGE